MMKKLVLTFVLAFAILIVPMKCEAKDKAVTISSATVSTSGAQVTGTTDAPAVMIQIRNANNDIVTMASFAVVNNSFSGNITESLTAGGTYTIYVADYEGGAFTTKQVTVSQNTSSASSDSDDDSDDDSASATPVTVIEQRIYTVVKGDNLTKISRKLNVTLWDLITWNTIKNKNLIHPGQKLVYYVTVTKIGDQIIEGTVLPGTEGGNVYIVKRGDSLSKIARKLNVSLKHILSKNKIKNINLIYAGQKIYY